MRKTKLAVLIIFFISGASGLIYEVVWTRMLTLVFGSTVFAISAVLTSLMAGLALGSFYFGRLADNQERPLRVYAYLEAGIGIFALIFPLILWLLNGTYVFIHRQIYASFYPLSLIRFVLSFLVLLIPTALMGATLPIISKFYVERRDNLGWDMGRLYSLNTFGAMVGTLAAGFFLVNFLGVNWTLRLAAFINLAIAAIAFFLERQYEQRFAAQRRILRAIPFAEEGLFRPILDVREDEEEEEREPMFKSAPRAGTPMPEPWEEELFSLALDEEEEYEEAERPYADFIVKLAFWAFAISGYCSLAYEVLWTRLLVFFLGSTTYAFATILAAFLFGIAAGSFIFAKVADRWRNLPALFGTVQLGIGLLAILLLPAFGELWDIRTSLPGGRIWSFFAGLIVMLPPTILMGGSFPLVARIYTPNINRLGRRIGNLYSINILGAIAGFLLPGFVLIPLIGIQKSIILIASINAIMGGLLIFCSQIPPRFRWSVVAITLAILVMGNVAIPSDVPVVLKSAIFKFQQPGGRLIGYNEDIGTSVTAMADVDGIRRLYVDEHQVATDSRRDSPSHRVIAHLPLLLHKRPKRALVVGFGMGVTTHAITQHGVEVDAIEISRGVIKANKYFTSANGNVLKNPLVHPYEDDGRNFILTTRNKYDVISTRIIPPLVSSGSSSIYSKDFYELCKRVLTADGIMCQWVSLHRLPEKYYQMIIRTFIEVFPHTTLWYKYTPDFVILIGTPEKLRINYQDFIARAQIPTISKGLRHDDLDGISLLDSFMMNEETVKKYVGAGPIHTDDKPRLEFFGSIPSDADYKNLRSMQNLRESVSPLLTNIGRTAAERAAVKDKLDTYFKATQHLVRGQIDYARGEYEPAVEKFQTALNLNPNDDTIKYNLSVAAELAREDIDAQMSAIEKGLLDELRRNPRDSAAYRQLGVVYQSQGKNDKAIEAYEESVRINPNQVEIHLELGKLHASQGQIDKSIHAYKRVTELEPNFFLAHGNLAELYALAGVYDEAIVSAKKAIELQPNLWLAHYTLGSIYLDKEQSEDAIKSFEKAIELNPNSPLPYNNLGIAYTELKKYDEAVSVFKQAIQVDPNFGMGYLNLAKLYIERNIQLDEAIQLAQQALKIRQSPEALDVLAAGYFAKGMYQEALDEINKAIKLAPAEDAYRKRLEQIREKIK